MAGSFQTLPYSFVPALYSLLPKYSIAGSFKIFSIRRDLATVGSTGFDLQADNSY
jgi:hypothetical protein